MPASSSKRPVTSAINSARISYTAAVMATPGITISNVTGTAMAKGVGTLNDQAVNENGNPYRFWFWATDGNPDTFRVRIWTEDDSQYLWWRDAGGEVIYDNGSELPINNGNVQVIVGNGNANSSRNTAQADGVVAEELALDEQTPDRQIFLPVITNDAVLRAAVVEESNSDADTTLSDIAPVEPAQGESDTMQTMEQSSRQIFLPLVANTN